MRVDPETIYQALFNTICGINAPQAGGAPSLTPLTTMSRRWRKWDQVGDELMPAFYQFQPPDGIKVDQVRQFGPGRYRLKADLYFYIAVSIGDLTTPTSPVLNAYFKAVDQILYPTIQSPGGARQQLGLGPGVEHCWIDGTVIFDEGLLNPPAILMVPITIISG